MRSQPALRPLGLLVPAAALLLAGCGGGDNPDQPPASQSSPAAAAPTGPALLPAANPAAPGTDCGPVTAIGGAKAKVVVREGSEDCAQATQVLTEYFQKITPAEANKPDGAGPVSLGGWTCGSGSPTDPTTCSTEDGRLIEGSPAK
ncbi:hypothetical protein [Amycolatopsis anabasis]|uniref:hypothetical protein n=1 Tax=Amycolatopsis anabasis TaxID=1840409 RepID=UPI00131C047B|nr:hypothetical protein [Amycolatopsis anabasis]